MNKHRMSADSKKARDSQYSYLKNKPKMQTKWKDRLNNSAFNDRPASSQRQKSQSKNQFEDSFFQQYKAKGPKVTLGHSNHNHSICQANRKQFDQTASKLYSTNFKHHDIDCCVCQSCTCGRHLCKFHAIAPDMSKNSVYKQSYPKKSSIPNIVNHDTQYPKMDGPHLEMNSTQRKDFIGKKGDDLDRPHPQDLLKAGGPCGQLTSYSSGFPGHRGQNQYVKPTDNHIRGDFPLKAHSTYSKTFHPHSARPASSAKNPDNFKHGQPWLGHSSYNNFYKNTNPQNFPNHVKIVQKREINPDYKYQYATTYKNDFLNKNLAVCPAKIELETKMKGKMTHKKDKFGENSDFKALSPQFHAFSLSKHTFI